ncbi:MAG: glycosyltransferase family 2 protein [Anaerolineales bacterium]
MSLNFTQVILKPQQIQAYNYTNLAAILPAYNEAGRVGKVVRILRQVELLDEIIVVDDGSVDGTSAETLDAAAGDGRLSLLRHKINCGKGQAILSGWQATRAANLLFLDADLINLEHRHIIALAEPVLNDWADMTVGLFRQGYWRTDLAHRLTPWLSGQRCLRAGLLSSLSMRAAAGYGFETALSLAARKQGWRCEDVYLWGVSHLPGDVADGWRGPFNKVRMYAHILRAWCVFYLGLGQEL